SPGPAAPAAASSGAGSPKTASSATGTTSQAASGSGAAKEAPSKAPLKEEKPTDRAAKETPARASATSKPASAVPSAAGTKPSASTAGAKPGSAGTGEAGTGGTGGAGKRPPGPGGNGPSGQGGGSDNGNGSGETPIPTARRASLIGAGLVGALIALGIYLGLYYGGILPRDQSTVMDAVVVQSQELGRRIATLESSAARDAKRDLGKEVNDIQSALKELGSDPKNALVRRVRDLEASLGTLTGTGDDAAGPSLDSRVAALEEKLEGAGGAASGDAETLLSDLARRVEALETRPAATGADGTPPDTPAPIAALSDRMAALDKQLQQTADQVAALAKSGSAATDETLARLESELTAMRDELDKLSGTVSQSATTVDDKLAAFRTSIEERDANAAQEAARTAAGALALTGLAKAVDSGAPYTAELDVLRPLVGDSADLAVLADHAAAGVPDAQTLATRFDAVSDEILSAGADSQTGLVGSLMTSARSLVRVRPTGEAEGEGRGATVARIEAALQAGELSAAESEWASLDAPALQASQSWADDLKARIAVEGALEKISSSLTASLSEPASTPPAQSGKPAPGKANAKPGNGKANATSSAAPEPATN
ncbi:hypothetical protein ACFOHM_00950, partial [Microbaculum marinum]